MTSKKTALYNDNFPIYFNDYGEADAILFGLKDKEADKYICIKELLELPIKELNIISPEALTGLSGIITRYVDWDYHINLEQFDLDLKGNRYKNIRYSVNRAEKIGYRIKFGKELTRRHIYILSRHITHHKLDVWDVEELLSLDKFLKFHNHGLLMEAYYGDELIGFDLIDFFEDNKIMVVPLGIYLDAPSLPDFLLHENIKYAKKKGCNWLDIGVTCREIGLQDFKKKWHAEPKYKLFVQNIKKPNI